MSNVKTLPNKRTVNALLEELGRELAGATDEEFAAARDALEDMHVEQKAAKRRAEDAPGTYEIVNPSDEAYLDAPDFASACAAVLVLGQGDYGLREVGGSRVMPAFTMCGMARVTAWIKGSTGYASIEQLLTAKRPAVAGILETVRLKHERTSMSDLVGRAKDFASLLRENLAAEASGG